MKAEGSVRMEIIAFGSAEYRAMRHLREELLRRPLGRKLTAADLRGEEKQDHFGLRAPGGDWIGGVMGCAVAGQPPCRRLRQMLVIPTWQGHGMGRHLLREVEAHYARQGVQEIVLHARESALGFYERAGYLSRGEAFVEVGIPHREMRKRLAGSGDQSSQ